jgi:asparagine N-glycosylation enzyme membrane subunit Stt3
MADPELSLQSMLMVAAVIAWTKTLAYVGLVAVFSVGAGLLYGAWVDGLGWLPLATVLGGFLAVLAVTMGRLGRRQATHHAPV